MQVAKKSGIRMGGGLSMIKDGEHRPNSPTLGVDPYEVVRQLASSNAVVVFSISGCCMCTVAKRLLFSLGVGPTVVELDHHSAGGDIQGVLFHLLASGGQQPVPAIFVGGKFLGGIEALMAFHINGTLVPLLKDAGALWL
ncbi:Glutaredoxin-C9 [Turnera subulata]|uniref:Glutaredoxin-C9 n=1 Tax=Turnera subulata TaxID=218843 RepID=A0A9Q0F557_9ROSI|nr:Glutaredoxin-C9 [Turnera subulata]